MSRTILYYPNVEVPTSGPWIRRALLYWDHVAAIVPRSYDDYMDARAINRFRPEMQELYNQQVFRPLDPGRLFQDPVAAEGFTTDWRALNLTRPYRPNYFSRRECSFPIYKDKTSDGIFGELQDRGLATDTGNPLFYYLEPHTAAIYMALLAKHLAAVQSILTTPGTDLESLSNRVFGKNAPGNLEPVLSAVLMDILPVPHPGVPLQTILKFRQAHQSELLSFRAALDEFEKTIATANANQEIVNLTEKFKEKIQLETIELSKALKSSKIGTALGSLQSFIKPTSPTLLGTAAVLAGHATSITNIPVSWIAAGATAAGLIEVGMHWFSKAEDRSQAYRDTPFAYLFLARKKLARFENHSAAA